MKRKVLFRTLLYVVLEALLAIGVIYYSGYYLSDVLKDPRIWIFPILATALSLFLGWFFHMVIQYSKKIRSFYLTGLNVGFSIYFMLCVYFYNSAWQFNQRYGFSPASQLLLKDIEDIDESGRSFVGTGFQLLQSEFRYPRRLRLRSYYFQERDTLIDRRPDTIRIIYYTYLVGMNPRKWYSKVSVLQDKATMLVFNSECETSSEYAEIKKAMAKDRKESMEKLKELIRELPQDSTSAILKKAVRDDSINRKENVN
ncbi:MAG: hypothetical protein BGO55_18060 [Sphingobacteriales bacterium 50-39]|nr:hypothetical protein [Sphingobacteriales bacterium]OJW54976.1 MAG: hypothetical protein BGO55_18060 [Sphingobacteriales bacterium 50-39]